MPLVNTEKIIGEFNKNKYVVVRNFLPSPLLEVFYRYTLMKVSSGQTLSNDPQVPGTPMIFADTLSETILGMATPQMEQLVGKRLYPTYSYFRVYKHGDVLQPHIDRPSSEFGMTVYLGFDNGNEDPAYRWKIYMDNRKDYRHHVDEARMPIRSTENVGVGVALNPGDCVLYRGCEVRHWRNALRGASHSQAFFMYVDQDGPYAKYRYDTRPALGMGMDTMTDRGPYEFFPE